MSIGITVIAGFIVLALVVVLLAATRPDTFRVERSQRIAAPPQKVFALINDFRNWSTWSPWEKVDPALERNYIGPAAGQGAVYSWKGNARAGQGRMQIAESHPPSQLKIRLDFVKPMKARNAVTFTLAAQEDATLVTWAMEGHAHFVARIFHVFFNMDRLVGKDFEAGLASMKAAAESRPCP